MLLMAGTQYTDTNNANMFIGNGSGLTNAAGNPFLDKTATNNLGALAFSNRVAYASLDGAPTIPTTNSVVQTNDTRSLNLTNSANVFAGTFDATTNTMTFGPGMVGQIVSANLTGWPLGLYFFANPNGLIQMTPIPIPLNVINMKTNYVITLTTLSTNANSIVGYIPFWNFYLNNTDVGNTTTIYRTNMLANTIYSWSFPLSISPSWTTSNILTGGIHCGILANATNAVISYNVSVMSF